MTATETPTATGTLPNPPAKSDRVGAGIDYDLFLDCVHCGLCTSACPTYLETGDENDSPRGRIYLMRGVVDGRIELTNRVQRHLDLCLDCRSCETACPSGVQYGRLIEPFRVDQQRKEAERERKRPDWFHRWILYGLFPYPNRLRWSLAPARWMQKLGVDALARRIGLTKLLPPPLRRMHDLLPPLPSPSPRLPEFLPAEGTRRARVGLFTGCVADAMQRPTHWATARVLQANGCDVVVPRDQACCGAIHYHSGAGEPALALADQNVDAFDASDLDAVIVNVAGCGSMLKDYGHVAHELRPGETERGDRLGGWASRVRDVSEFLAELGPIAPTGEVAVHATYHDACHLCHAQGVRKPPRDLLGSVPGLKLTPLSESEICCGAAGSYNLVQPEMADRLGERKVANLLATGAEAVITGNAGCALQIRAMLRKAGREDVRVVHPMDVLDLAHRGGGSVEDLPR